MKKKASPADSEEPKAITLYTIKLDESQMRKLHDRLSRGIDLWAFSEVDHALFGARRDKVNVVAYKSGKLVVSGKGTEEFIRDILEPEITGEARLGYDEVHHPEWFEDHAGLDESGKGDLFGPVVVATVVAPGAVVPGWIKAGIKDSKAVGSDAAVLKLEKQIRDTPGVVAVVKTTFSGMEKYNELYIKFQENLNRYLGWLHAQALKEALEKKRVSWGLLDQFSKTDWTGKFLADPKFDLRMRPKAEEDPVVAAASILARAEYVRQMKKLSDAAGETLLKGAGPAVLAQAKGLVERLGPEALPRFAKMHFRTAYQALGQTPPEKKPFVKYGR
jgi:ribonuclease HIII